jgi:hypothetical protein
LLTPMKKRAIGGALCLLSLTSPLALAAPAPWFKWKSQLDGKIACLQVSPGEGWMRENGPYPDARCVPASSSSSTGRR